MRLWGIFRNHKEFFGLGFRKKGCCFFYKPLDKVSILSMLSHMRHKPSTTVKVISRSFNNFVVGLFGNLDNILLPEKKYKIKQFCISSIFF